MAERDVELRVTARDDTSTGLRSAERSVKSSGDRMERALKESGRRGLSGLGDQAGRSITSGLAGAVESVGRMAGRLGLQAGQTAAKSLSGAITNASPQVSSAMTAVLVGAAASAAPLLGATVAGAVVGGAAGVGILGGIALASGDARVAAAGQALGARLLGSLRGQSSAFIGPLLGAISDIQARFDRMQGTIGAGLAAAARYVRPLTHALLDAGEAITVGLSGAIQRAGPIINAVAGGIRGIGSAVGEMLLIFSQLGPQGAQAFSDLLWIVEQGIRFFTTLTASLAQVYGWFRTLGGLLGDDAGGLEDVATSTQDAAGALTSFVPKLDATATAAGSASGAVRGLAAAERDLAGEAVALDQAQINLTETLATVTRLREKGNTVTSAERQGLIDLKGAIDAEVEALRTSGAASADVNARANELRESFIRQATQMGYNKREAEELANRYGMFPRNVDTSLRLTGAEEARRELERVRAKAGSIPDQINIAIRVTGSAASRAAIAAALGKQNMMAGSAARYREQEGAQFAAARAGFAVGAPVGGATVVESDPRVTVDNNVSVLLDQRPLLPTMYRVATAVQRAAAWRERVGTR